MKTLKIAYFNQLGRKDLDRVVDQFTQKYPDIKISLIGMGHDEVFDKLAEQDVDLAINDLRDEQVDFNSQILGQKAVMAILQKGSYPSGIQMINKDDLVNLTCFIVAKPEEEAAELHLFKDIYQIQSPFIASNSVEEAALLVASGSGYFLMNEATAGLISNDTLQQLFLLSNGQQMWQKIAAFYTNEDAKIKDFISLVQKVY